MSSIHRIAALDARARLGIKLAEEDEMTTTERVGRGAAGVAGVAGGAGLAASSPTRKYLTGREKYYHGTSPEIVERIKQEGIKPRKDIPKRYAARTATDVLDKDLVEKSKGLSFLHKNKDAARNYAEQKAELDHLRDSHRAGFQSPTNARDLVNAQMEARRSGVVDVDLPFWKYDRAVNPEAGASFQEYSDRKKRELVGRLLRRGHSEKDALEAAEEHLKNNQKYYKGGFKDYGERTFAVRGAVSPEHIKNSPKYKPLSGKEVLQYMKKSPGNFAKGVGLGGTALGLGAWGANELYESL